jgi:cbb3-type cytochrome c oxidase subunit II
MADQDRDRSKWIGEYEAHPSDWSQHPPKRMLMTPMLIVIGGLFAFAIPTLIAGFFHVMFFHPPVSQEWAPLPGDAIRGRQLFLANGCVYCHSGYTRPQDVRENLFYLYPRVSLPGDFATSDSAPNTFGTARIGPDLSQEAGWHPDDWEFAHFYDPRYVDPDSLMPDFKFLSQREVADLTAFLQTRSGKSGLIRYAGQRYMKKLVLASLALPNPPPSFSGAKKTLADVALEASNAPEPTGSFDGLDFPDPVSMYIVDRGYWMMSNPLPVTKENLSRGRMIFQERCIGCHGRGGSAISNAAKFMNPTPIDFTSPDDAVNGNDTSPGDYYYRVLRGIQGTAMENFGTRLRVDDIWRVVMFLKTVPNGGLDAKRRPTPEMYLQWVPNPDIKTFVAMNPIEANKDFTDYRLADSRDPFMQEAMRDLAGMTATSSLEVPNFGTVSLETAAAAIKADYEQMLAKGWTDYEARGGSPIPPPSQRATVPDTREESR